jgi:hypothetical protein
MDKNKIKKDIKETGEASFLERGFFCVIQESTTMERDEDFEIDDDVPCLLYDVYASEADFESGESSISGDCCTGTLSDCFGMLDDALGEAELVTEKE